MPTDKEKRKAMIAEKGDEFFMGYENFGRVMAKRTKSGLIGKGNGKGRIMTSACGQKEAVCGRIGGNGNTLEFFGQSAMYKPDRSPNSQRTIRGELSLLSLNSYGRLGASNNQIDGFGHGVTDASLRRHFFKER